MARPLDRIWVRFGLYVTLSVLLALAVLSGCLVWQHHLDDLQFRRSLPVEIRNQLDQLSAQGKTINNDDKVDDIYDQYWPKGHSELYSKILIGLGFSLLPGLIAAFLSARLFTRPIESVAQATLRISQGDLSARTPKWIAGGELGQMLDNFNQMADSLERLERERKETMAAISHELRTPLTILQGRLHAICDGVMPATAEEHRKLLWQIEHLVRLVEDLNTLALVEADRLSLNCTDLDLRGVVEAMVAIYSRRAQECGVRLEVEAHPLQVFADRDRLNQVLGNLMENGLRYAASGGWLQLQVYQEGDDAVIRINDRGPGLPTAVMSRIFEPFVRAGTGSGQLGGGTGLGLSVAQGLVRRLGGQITAQNRDPQGASFAIMLPLAYQLPKEARALTENNVSE